MFPWKALQGQWSRAVYGLVVCRWESDAGVACLVLQVLRIRQQPEKAVATLEAGQAVASVANDVTRSVCCVES